MGTQVVTNITNFHSEVHKTTFYLPSRFALSSPYAPL